MQKLSEKSTALDKTLIDLEEMKREIQRTNDEELSKLTEEVNLSRSKIADLEKQNKIISEDNINK